MAKPPKLDPDTAHRVMSDYLQDHERAHPGGKGKVDHGQENYSVIHWHRQKGWQTHSSGHKSLDIADTKARPLLEPHSGREMEYGMTHSSTAPGKDYDVKDSAGRSLAAVRVMKTDKAKEFLDNIDKHYPGIVKSRPE